MPSTAANRYGNQGLVPVLEHNMKAEELPVVLGNSLTLAKGTVLGQITATGKFIAYASGSSDGSQFPKCLLAYDTVTDSSGNHTRGGGDQGVSYTDTPAFFSGDFNAADLTGLDATALTNGKWMQVVGSITTGIIRIPS